MNSLFKVENGDFQTPTDLTNKICDYLIKLGIKPKVIVEPTCGQGTFIESSISKILSADSIYGFDINHDYIDLLKSKFANTKKPLLKIEEQDFFQYDWDSFIADQNGPILFVGNPPWVTNSKIGLISGKNLPKKDNFLKLNGFDALTGKSNFDISEWMLIKLSDALNKKGGHLAMLCKTSVARKILNYCWKNSLSITDSRIVVINAKEGFNVSVDACLLYINFGNSDKRGLYADVYNDFEDVEPTKRLGFKDGSLISDLDKYLKNRHFIHNVVLNNRWRSGIKHDCSKVMELKKTVGSTYINGLGETIQLEDDYVYPLMKSSDVSNRREPNKWVIVTQHKVNEDTSCIKDKAPLLWLYLRNHADYLNKRVSRIYTNRPEFSVFGIGPYTFCPWKIAISGFYKYTEFNLVGPLNGKPVLFDDTVNFLAYENEVEAKADYKKLTSPAVQDLIKSMTFWDSKRPITTSLLNMLVKK